MKTSRIVLARRPHGEPTASDLPLETTELPAPTNGQALLETLWLSLDPYMRGRMDEGPSYAPAMEVGDTIVGGTVSRVLECPGGELAPGDMVLGYGGWQAHSVEHVAGLRPIDSAIAEPQVTLGVLGMPGFTAWAGLLNIGKPQPGETVVVAAATGPVGSTVGQIARTKGARAVGIAGGPEKVAYLRELGFDAAIDRRAEDFAEQLAAATPDGIDVYFENVGGAVLQAVLPRLNTFARVPVCGLVSGYNATSLPEGPDRSGMLMGLILIRSLTVRGFIQSEFMDDQLDDFIRDMSGWLAEGRVKHREHVIDGLENAVDAFNGMLRGDNFGKTLVRVAK
ncbi:MAG: NADP-dependent oxidoreductase [Dermatophilus congolensis]|nr:NADP-dependent oxidoreductase [Dermatophilus congolensis]